jgi:hypothetical protein
MRESVPTHPKNVDVVVVVDVVVGVVVYAE